MLETDGSTALGIGGGACIDASSNHTGIDSLASCEDGAPTTSIENDSPGFTIADGNWHTTVVRIQKGAFTVAVDGISQFSGYSPSGWSNGSDYLGFGGGTGASRTITACEMSA